MPTFIAIVKPRALLGLRMLAQLKAAKITQL